MGQGVEGEAERQRLLIGAELLTLLRGRDGDETKFKQLANE